MSIYLHNTSMQLFINISDYNLFCRLQQKKFGKCLDYLQERLSKQKGGGSVMRCEYLHVQIFTKWFTN